MDEQFKQVFNSIYAIFVQNGFIDKHNDQDEEKKQKAFENVVPFFLSIQQALFEKDIQDNVEQIVNALNIPRSNRTAHKRSEMAINRRKTALIRHRNPSLQKCI